MTVAINGIGVAGPTLACWLRAFGHEPVLFENAPAFRDGGYLIDFSGSRLRRCGTHGTARQAPRAWLFDRAYALHRRAWARNGVTRRGTAARDAQWPLYQPRALRPLPPRWSAPAAASPPAMVCQCPRSTARATGRRSRRSSDGRTDRFDLVVGADGLHSHIRAAVFGPQAQFETFLGCYVAAFRVTGYPRRDKSTYVVRTVPKRQVARVSLRNDETLMMLICRSELVDGSPSPGRTEGGASSRIRRHGMGSTGDPRPHGRHRRCLLRPREPDPPPALVVRPSRASRRRGGLPVAARR